MIVLLLAGCGAEPVKTGTEHTAAATENAEDKDVRIASEILAEHKEVKARMAQGMTLLYTGEKQEIDGRECYIFALGTNREEQFVREYLYGVCDNLIYSHDVLTDTWEKTD